MFSYETESTMYCNCAGYVKPQNRTYRTDTGASSYAVACMYVQSNEKVPFSMLTEGFARKCWKVVFLASERVGDFSSIYPELFPASPGGRLQKTTVISPFFYSCGLNTITIVHRIKENVFLQGPSCKKSPSAFLRSDWVKTRLQSSIGSNKTFFVPNRSGIASCLTQLG